MGNFCVAVVLRQGASGTSGLYTMEIQGGFKTFSKVLGRKSSTTRHFPSVRPVPPRIISNSAAISKVFSPPTNTYPPR